MRIVYGRVRSIAKDYFDLAGGWVPVDLGHLWRHLGLDVVAWNAPPEFTAALCAPARTIAVNPNAPVTRVRFSIAHELGHFAFRRSGLSFFGREGASERAANAFAAELLMPKPVVFSICGQLNRNCEPVRRWPDLVACRLGVSREAARVRLKEIRLN
jgi:hypothetical protein